MIEDRKPDHYDYLNDENYPRAMFYKALAFDMSLKRKIEAKKLYQEFVTLYEDDKRTFVQALVQRARKYRDRLIYGL